MTSATQNYEASANYEAKQSWKDLYSVEWTPKELCLKFRQQMEGFQIGANFEVPSYAEFDRVQDHGCRTKIVFKPVGSNPNWKLMFEPKQGDLRLFTKKISLGSLLSFQVGVGHDFRNKVTGWQWKLTTALGDMWPTRIQQKTKLPICPGFDVRIGWNAEFVLPDVHGTLGVGMGVNPGHLCASLERVEAILTHVS